MAVIKKEREILRELAKRQAEIAALPEMAERRALWYDLNDGKTGHPLVTMEFHGLEQDVYPAQVCMDPLARALERQMGQTIYKHGHYRDDRVIPDSVSVTVPNEITPFGRTVAVTRVKKADGTDDLGYIYDYAVNDMEADLALFGPSVFSVDAGLARASAAKSEVEDIVGDIIGVRIECPSFLFSPGNILIRMMHMETLFCSILDYPDLFHKVMRRLTDEFHAYMDAIETGGALLLNNDASMVHQDSYGYTRCLPNLGAGGVADMDRPVRFADVWGYSNSQETVGMSVAMFDEFFFTYIKEIMDRCGLVSYGCCEPVHSLWDKCLSRMKNLRKLSVSPWCDEEDIGEKLRGTGVCYHRKPSPNYISVDSVFDERAFLEHMGRTVRAARGCPLEITFRDITSVRGEPWRLDRAVELTREAFARWG